jgi:hypothetical protein
MDFGLNEHQQQVQRKAREFAAATIGPVAGALDPTPARYARLLLPTVIISS